MRKKVLLRNERGDKLTRYADDIIKICKNKYPNDGEKQLELANKIEEMMDTHQMHDIIQKIKKL